MVLTVSQEAHLSGHRTDYHKIKNEVKKSRRELQEELAQDTLRQLNPQLQRAVELAQEKDSSAWLTVLPVAEHVFFLHKGEFRDTLCLRYEWNLSNTPRSCNCGASFSVNHAMICQIGGIPTICHNELRDITATLLTNIWHMFQPSHFSNPSQMNYLIIAQPIQKQMLDLTSVLEIFGT